MYEKVTKELIKECTDDLEYYDNNGHFPFDKKPVLVTLSYASIDKLKGLNRSKEIDKLIQSIE
ncbi:MAG: hypothetical protein GXO79_11530 [Chlorobi bacterium]|nr:hypothetical protein [Chlorobiota bacterium]